MESRIYNVNLQSGYNSLTYIGISQYDAGVPLQFNVYDGATAASFPVGTTATIMGVRPSGVGFSIACTLTDNVVTVDTSTDMTGEAGKFPVEIRFTASGVDVGTVNFIFLIEKAPHPDGTIDADITRQQEFIDRLEALEEEIVPDQTLRIRGRAADAKSTGDGLRTLATNLGNKISVPTGGYGTSGQVLSTLGNGQTQWVDIATGGALTEEIVDMLMTVLTNAVYVSDQSANLEALREMLEEITPHIPTNDIDVFGSTILINETVEAPTPDADNGWLII